MARKHQLFILIPAIILIPLLLGTTPLNIAHKLSEGGPLIHCKQMRLGGCLFNSLVSQDGHTVAEPDSAWLEQDSTPTDDFIVLDIDAIYHNVSSDSVPLRC